MHATTVAVDLAKSVFQIAVADDKWKVIEQHRLTRSQFERWFQNREVSLVIMEACGSAHHWGRWFNRLGIEVRLLPAAYIRAYVKRNKTDAADACALLEAARCADIVPVQVKSVEQQALQGLHRIRSRWMATRTSRINTLRGFCREFGLVVPQGARTGIEAMSRALADPGSAVPALIRESMKLLIEEIRLLEQRIGQLERELTALARQSPACTQLLTIPGIGLLTATAMVAATGGTVRHFKDARHFASWFGLTPKEFSSGNTRKLGRISKKGDRYLRMLLTHGARVLLRAAVVGRNAGRSLDGLRTWATNIQARTHHNKAACVMTNGNPLGITLPAASRLPLVAIGAP
ncbi:IS110 family transposase [Denitratisoma oestradiolicum]|uniref:Transposase n=1 Tax=Denitratisoma oestradiolicum TaxID=311182 RepID=A0A6S6XVG4_9PROT|nr:IS110 family transposase [Denitratisoma oestradiolicum]CAB1369939.1 transposase [Denitratisoma oestradiolicum]